LILSDGQSGERRINRHVVGDERALQGRLQGLLLRVPSGRSPHQALDALTVGIQRKRVNWVLDADIRGFFDN